MQLHVSSPTVRNWTVVKHTSYATFFVDWTSITASCSHYVPMFSSAYMTWCLLTCPQICQPVSEPSTFVPYWSTVVIQTVACSEVIYVRPTFNTTQNLNNRARKLQHKLARPNETKAWFSSLLCPRN